MIKHNSSEAKLSTATKQLKKNSSYGLFYSPREVSAKHQQDTRVAGDLQKNLASNVSPSYSRNIKSRDMLSNNLSHLTDKLEKF